MEMGRTTRHKLLCAGAIGAWVREAAKAMLCKVNSWATASHFREFDTW